MSSDQGPVIQSALLRSELVRLRKEQHLTQEQVARALDWSPSKLIRIEGGKNSVTKTDLQALLLQYGITAQSRLDRLQELARGAREPAWWNSYRDDVSTPYLTFVGFEAGASHIRHFHGALVPGLLQLPEYAQALASGSVASAMAVKLRIQRQQELAKRTDPPRQSYIVDEAVIRRHIGIRTDPAIMPNQLRHMANAAEGDSLITLRVIPFSAGAHLGLRGSFTILGYEGPLSDVLYLEGGRAPSTLITNEEQVAEYSDYFEILGGETLSPEDSIELIREAAEELMS